MQAWLVQEDWVGQGIDVTLARQLSLSRRHVRRGIDAGLVRCNGMRVRRGGQKLGRGDRLEWLASATGVGGRRPPPFNEGHVLGEDKDYLVINKPAGLACEVRGGGVLDWIGDARLHLCHRLDKETTGVLLLGKDTRAVELASEGFRTHAFGKTYVALVDGRVSKPSWQVRSRLQKPVDGFVRSGPGGRLAVTGFWCLHTWEKLGLSLLRAEPLSGRTHQIRVHLAEAGTAIVGDKKYGKGVRAHWPEAMGRWAGVHHFLHAARLRWKDQEWCAPLPESWAAVVKTLEGGAAFRNIQKMMEYTSH